MKRRRVVLQVIQSMCHSQPIVIVSFAITAKKNIFSLKNIQILFKFTTEKTSNKNLFPFNLTLPPSFDATFFTPRAAFVEVLQTTNFSIRRLIIRIKPIFSNWISCTSRNLVSSKHCSLKVFHYSMWKSKTNNSKVSIFSQV